MSTGAAPKWEQWWNTKGDSGEEPPEEIKEYYQRLEDMMYLTSGTQEYVDHMHAIFDLHSENVYQIGTVGMMGRVIPLNKKLKNVPLEDGRLWGIWPTCSPRRTCTNNGTLSSRRHRNPSSPVAR